MASYPFSFIERWAAYLFAALLLLVPSFPQAAPSAPAAPPVPSGPPPEPTTEGNVYLPTVEEIKMGREASVEVEKEYKLVKDEQQLQRLRSIGEELLRTAYSPEQIK